MEDARFDAISRSFSTSYSRRGVGQLIGGVTVSGLLLAFRAQEARAARRIGGCSVEVKSERERHGRTRNRGLRLWPARSRGVIGMSRPGGRRRFGYLTRCAGFPSGFRVPPLTVKC